MIACRIVPGQPGGCPSFPPPTVTHVGLGLTLTADDSGPVLVPAWLFTIGTDPEPAAVVAVQARFLAPPPTATSHTGIAPGPPVLPGTNVPAPAGTNMTQSTAP